jgi:hypothetical protein
MTSWRLPVFCRLPSCSFLCTESATLRACHPARMCLNWHCEHVLLAEFIAVLLFDGRALQREGINLQS